MFLFLTFQSTLILKQQIQKSLVYDLVSNWDRMVFAIQIWHKMWKILPINFMKVRQFISLKTFKFFVASNRSRQRVTLLRYLAIIASCKRKELIREPKGWKAVRVIRNDEFSSKNTKLCNFSSIMMFNSKELSLAQHQQRRSLRRTCSS